MRVVCAPDSFKETLTAPQAAAAMARGAELAGAENECCPVADGGEGTLEVLLEAKGGRRLRVPTMDPLGRSIEAEIGYLDDAGLAVVEMAAACGLGLLKSSERDPLRTTSFGAGQLIAIAAREADRVLLGVGGTATVDGGCGILQALGARCLDSIGEPIEDPITGGTLSRVTRIEVPAGCPIIEIAADVDVPLLGEHGAAKLFGPQKGADEATVEQLEANLLHLADVLDPPGVTRLVRGGGAAGGAAFGLHASLDAQIFSGIDLVLDAIRFEDRLENTDIVIVGEGSLDAQSLHGKASMVTARRAAERGIAVVAISGRLGTGWQDCLADNGGPLQDALSLADHFGTPKAMKDPTACLQEATRHIIDIQ